MRLIASLAVVVLAMSVASPASGAVVVDRGGDLTTVHMGDQAPGDDTKADPSASNSPSQAPWYRYYLLQWSPSAGFCLEPHWTHDQAYATRMGGDNFSRRFDPQTGAPRPNCPADAGPIPTPQTIAAATWQAVKNLPVPTLESQPDFAITGKKVYLQIHGTRTWSQVVDNPIGDDITITATSTYVVHWDDPSHPGDTVTASQGGPWPDGDVTHTYTDVAPERDITVTQRWTATWTAGGQSGTLTQLQTQSAPLRIEVRQLQAVRDR